MGTECPYLLLENCPGRLWRGDTHRDNLLWGLGLQPANWRFYLHGAAARRERPLGCSGAVRLHWELVQSQIKGKWHHTSPESSHLSCSTIPTHSLMLKRTPKRTTPSRKSRALLFQAMAGLVSNSSDPQPSRQHRAGAENIRGSQRTPAQTLLTRVTCHWLMQRHCCSHGIPVEVSHHEGNAVV